MSMTMFLGKVIETTDSTCPVNGGPSIPITRPYVNFYVRVTDLCRANCGFCPYHNKAVRAFDIDKFGVLFKEALDRFYINKVVITGGEPTLNLLSTFMVIEYVHEMCPTIPISINTNGDRLKGLGEDPLLSAVHDISLSMHHYIDIDNDTIFGGHQGHATTQDVATFPYMDKLHLRCNLIRNFIDSPDHIYRYIDALANIGVRDFGFVALMKVNDFCKDYFISYEEAGVTDLPNTLLTEQRDKVGCSCRNYIMYTEKGYLVRFYTRLNEASEDCRSTLVYDQDRLLKGFGGEVIA